jgi:hypothetical protein
MELRSRKIVGDFFNKGHDAKLEEKIKALHKKISEKFVLKPDDIPYVRKKNKALVFEFPTQKKSSDTLKKNLTAKLGKDAAVSIGCLPRSEGIECRIDLSVIEKVLKQLNNLPNIAVYSDKELADRSRIHINFDPPAGAVVCP